MDQNPSGQTTLCNFTSATEVTCSVSAVNSVGTSPENSQSLYTQFKSKKQIEKILSLDNFCY